MRNLYVVMSYLDGMGRERIELNAILLDQFKSQAETQEVTTTLHELPSLQDNLNPQHNNPICIPMILHLRYLRIHHRVSRLCFCLWHTMMPPLP